ncbi:MAG TPA: MFS transporter [Acidimicrobiales bacterium]|nr:MFS transporter [Acidimicrobiales bacterium]
MARIVNHFADPPPNLLEPRNDVVHEVREPDGSFAADGGPFTAYRRSVEGEGGTTIETIEYSLAVPYFGFLFAPLTRRALRTPPTRGIPWWAPPERLDARASTALGVLCAVALIIGYLNTLLTQTIAFAADEFGSSDRAQGVSLAIVRCGVVLALIIGGMADRQGRRKLIIGLSIAGPVVAATGALAPSLAWLTVSQTVARPLAMALGILVAVVAVEEMPAGSRAYAISLLAMATALGAGACVVALPLADLGLKGWRLVYVVPLLGLLLVPGISHRLHESRRYEAPHAEARLAGHAGRFWLLAASGMLLNLFVAPASAFQNRYLKDERGFSASRISLLTLLTNTPGGIGIIAGGRLADMRGRRIVGSIALFGGTVCTVWFFFASGWALWVASTIGAIVGAASVPALGVYSAELFPTSLRGRANAAITVLALVGSGIGLIAAGAMSDRWGEFAPGMALLAVGPIIVCMLVLTLYPETAHRELEDINPEDAVPSAT